MKIKVLGICGSPRKGNSKFLLEKALSYVSKLNSFDVLTETYFFRGKEFKPCIACGYCARNAGKCVHNDDFSELKDKWLDADVILYSIPVYHMGIPGQVKCFIDRLGNSLFSTFKDVFEKDINTLPKLLKVIGSISQGIHLFSGQEHVITDLINHALMMQCIPVTGDMWESYIGASGWTNNNGEPNAMEEDFKKGNFDTCVSVEAAKKIALRAVEIAVIVKSGISENKSYFTQQAHYSPLLKKLFNE